MPRALMVSSSFLPGRGGIESYLGQLCDELSPHLAVLAPHERDGKQIPADLSFATAGYRGTMLVPNRRIVNAIETEGDRHGVEKVLFGTPWPLVLLGPRLRERGMAYSVIVHGAELLVPAAIPGLRMRLAQALSQADLLLAVSEFTGAKLRSFLLSLNQRVPPIDLLRARVDLERFHPDRANKDVKSRLGLEEGQRFVLSFGRLVPRKGTDRLLRAADEIALRAPDTAFVVAGTGPQLRRLNRLAAKSKARVIFTGRVPEDDAPGLYATADVFAFPVVDRWFGLDVEGLGVVLLEAAACGTPCVTGRSGGTPEAVVEGESGYVVDATDPSALVDRITCLLEDSEQATRMGAAGRSFVADEFSKRPLPRSLLKWLELEPVDDRSADREVTGQEG
ncbi:MAG: glycosyltransferase family 4 protein [Actinomycetota bacterium]|nr:glycosyltransferase family 4 protein [Actinomycetota bacterium]